MAYTLKEVNKNIETLSYMLERVVEEEKEKQAIDLDYTESVKERFADLKKTLKDSLSLWGNINKFKQ